MKKNLYLIAFCLFVFASAKAQYVTIADTSFRSFLMSKYPTCFNASKQMDTTCSAILSEDTLNISNHQWNNILPIKYFKNLTYLDMSGISSLGITTTVFRDINLEFPNSILYLNMSNNKIRMWYDYFSSPITYAYTYPFFTKFPSSLKELKCTNITFGGPPGADFFLGDCEYKLPSLPNSLETLEYSFLRGPDNNGCYVNSRPASYWCFNSTTLPTNLKYLRAEKLTDFFDYNGRDYKSVLPSSTLPSSLKTLICKNCFESKLDSIFLNNTLPNLDTLIIPESKSFIKYLPNSIKYVDMHETGFDQYYYNANNHLDTLLQYKLDSLQYLDIGFNYHQKLNLFTKSLKTLKIDDNNNYLTDFTLLTNSMYSSKLNNFIALKSIKIYSSSLDTLNIFNNPNLINLVAPYDTLKSLSIYNNTSLPSLSFTSNSLKDLNVYNNQGLASINIVDNTLNNFKLTGNSNLLNASLSSNSIINFSPTNNASLDILTINSTSLKYLNCSNNLLTHLSSNCSVLDTLICNINQLNSISSLSNSIRYFTCRSNKLTALPNVPTSLNYFNCNNNLFATLPALPNGIQYLDCSNMGINPATNTKLNTITNLPNSLKHIDCSNNSLVYLPPLSTSATKILCSGNLLHTLPVLPNTLKYLDCSNNYFLTTMPSLSNVLDTMKCNINNLTRLPSLPNSLKYLDCSKNAMTYLPELPDGLSYLHCWNNDFYCLPKLPSALSEFWVSTLHIACMPNTVNCDVTEVHDTYGTGYYNAVLNPAPPLCNPASNANQCKFKPVMEGTIYYDINSNGIKDASEYYSKNIKVQLSTGAYTFTDNKGHYELVADSLGDYAIKIIAPPYYAAIPDTFHYTFTQYNASVTELVALQPKQNIDSLNVKITPWQNCARPAGNLDYIINYENVGTTNLSPVVTFNYDSALLTYVKSSNYFVANSGNKLTLNISSFAVGQTGGFTASFIVKSTDTLGSIINANTAIVGGSSTAVDSVADIVKSSFDPNDKQATPVLTPLQVVLGKDINYTIRFQNTGTDTAFNVVLTDTLSNQLQHNTLQLVGSSHNCKATVKDNVAVFEFLNINLPDSNTNSLKSHGFVNFKVKPINSLNNGDIVPNNAAIYFDYNTPVNTNTAYTQINTSGIIMPVKLLSYDARLVNEKTIENIWQTENEVGCSHYNIQRSLDGSKFETIGKVSAGKNNYLFSDVLRANYYLQNTLFYRLQIMDKNGSYAYSPIKRIQLNNKQQIVNIYPNPAKDALHIIVDSKAILKIYNIVGKQMTTHNLAQGDNSINIEQLSQGVYVAVIETANGVITKKIIKE